MKQVFRFDEDSLLDGTHDGAVVCNRGAQGPVTLTLAEDLPVGTELEIHRTENYAVTVTGQSAGDDLAGHGQSLMLIGLGSSVRLVLTGPHRWTGH